MTTRITIKLPISKVLESLNEKLTEREKLAQNYPKLMKQYDKDLEKWKAECVRFLQENPKSFEWAGAELGHSYQDEERNRVLVKFAIKASKLPERPKLPAKENENPNNHWVRDETKELAEAIRLLTMAEEAGQETISTGTYRNLSRWL
jgi:hypothetical protein